MNYFWPGACPAPHAFDMGSSLTCRQSALREHVPQLDRLAVGDASPCFTKMALYTHRSVPNGNYLIRIDEPNNF